MATEVYEVVVSGILAGQFVQTVQHVSATVANTTNPYAVARLIALDLAGTVVGSDFMNCLPSDYKGTSIRVRRVGPSGGPTSIILAGLWTETIGQRSGVISSSQVNPVIVWICNTDPSITGRLFLPGVSESDIDEMALTAGLVTAINDFITAWIAGGTLGGSDLYVGCVFRRLTKIGDLIEAGYVSPLIGTQRRRLRPV